MGEKINFKAIIDRADVPDSKGMQISREALKGVVEGIKEWAKKVGEEQFVIPILLRFNPERIIGRVHKIEFDEKTGELKVEGWVESEYVSPAMRCAPQYEVMKSEYLEKTKVTIFQEARLTSCGLTDEHSDPEIPPIEVENDC